MTSTSPDHSQPPWATVLAKVARRSRLRSALEQSAAFWASGAIAIATAALLGFLGLTGLAVAFFALAGSTFVLYVGSRITLALLQRADDPEQGAALIDRQQALDDTLKSALEPAARAHPPEARESHFRAFLEQKANAAAALLDPGALAPLRISPAFPIGGLLLAAAVVLLFSTEEFVLETATLETIAPFEQGDLDDEEISDDLLLAEELALTPEELLQLTPEQLAELKLRRGEALDLSDVEIETMSSEELSELLQELGSGSSSESTSLAEQASERGEEQRPNSDEPSEGAQSSGEGDGLEELRREAEQDPFAPPPGGEQAQQGEQANGNSLAPGDQANSDQVQKIELPPMANPNARQSEGGEPSQAVAMAGAEASSEMAIPPDASQSGAGGGESSGPQSSMEDPLGEITEIAVTLELALLEAEQEAERPIERSVRHRASEAQDAKVRRRGIRDANESSRDQASVSPVLSASEIQRMRRYFDPKQWPKEPPSED